MQNFILNRSSEESYFSKSGHCADVRENQLITFGRCSCSLKLVMLKLKWGIEILCISLQNCHQVNVTGPLWWLVNSDTGKKYVMTDAITRPQWVNVWNFYMLHHQKILRYSIPYSVKENDELEKFAPLIMRQHCYVDVSSIIWDYDWQW